MGDYCTPLGGIIEITPTEGQIMCPEGCILPQRDAVDRRSRHPEVDVRRPVAGKDAICRLAG